MKKTLLLASALFSLGTAQSQITITEANIVSALDVITQSNDTLPSVAIPSGGENQTWDYSTGLVAHEETSMSFTNPDWLANASYFPSANLGAVDQDGFEVFFIKDATEFGIVGFAGDFLGMGTGDVQLQSDPAEILLQFPANYNDSYTTSSSSSFMLLGADLGVPVDSIVVKTYTTKTVLIDAWGSISTPYGTFDALRVNEMSVETDSTWTYFFGVETLFDNNESTNYSYIFYSDDAATKFPVLEMSHDNAGTVYNVSWLKGAPAVSIDELASTNTSIFPNPAINSFNVDIKDKEITEIEIYQMDGSLVLNQEINAQTTLVDVSQVKAGVYIYKLIDVNQNVITTDKLVINK